MSSETYAPAMQAAPAQGERRLLRRALQLDAVVTGANGLVYVAAAGPLADPLGLSTGALRALGALLVVFAAGVWLLSTRAAIPRGAVTEVIAANVLWAAASIAALAFGWLSPETLGGVWIVLQALVVAAFAELQAYARSR